MPIKKGKAKAKNLGAFAVKRKNADSESDDEHTKKRPRMAPPDINSSDEDCATRGTFDANIDTESDPEETSPTLKLRRKTTFHTTKTQQTYRNGSSSVIST
ncbi:hypothetical protein B0H14DRAFT_2649302 [Mycena olivaceomarginata]|nr:hypothetical protein B0H14DRAFT_2649302 [Mycena olivaceomarginata]